MEPFSASGRWWLPESPDNAVAGLVSFKPGEPTELNLIGDFRTPHESLPSVSHAEYAAVLGLTTDGKPITLLSCVEKTRSIAVPSAQTKCTLVANFMLVGGHFDSIESILFDSIRVNYYGLEEWARLFETAQPEISQGEKSRKITSRFGYRETVTYDLGSARIKFTCEANYSQSLDLNQARFIVRTV
jgi:hypothetical protein